MRVNDLNKFNIFFSEALSTTQWKNFYSFFVSSDKKGRFVRQSLTELWFALLGELNITMFGYIEHYPHTAHQRYKRGSSRADEWKRHTGYWYKCRRNTDIYKYL